MKILIVSPGFSGGGAEDCAINTANYFFKRGFKITFLTFHSEGPTKSRLNSEIELKIIKVKNYFSLSFNRNLRKERYDHTFSFIRHTNIFTFLAWKMGSIKTTKLHLIEQNTFDQQVELNRISCIIQNILLFFSYNFCSDVIAVSEKVKDQIKEKFRVRKNVRVIGNPSLSNELIIRNQARLKDIIKTSQKPCNFVAIGRLHHQKGFDELIPAFRKFIARYNQNARLTIFGEGPQRAELETYIRLHNLQEKIFLPGYINKIEEKLLEFDVFLMSSRYEGFGLVVIQALAAGLPCISRKNIGGPDDILDNSSGQFYSTENELINRLNDIQIEDYKIEKLLTRAKQFSIEKICEEYLE